LNALLDAKHSFIDLCEDLLTFLRRQLVPTFSIRKELLQDLRRTGARSI